MRGLFKDAWPRPEFSVKGCDGCEKRELFPETHWTGSKNEVQDTPYCKDPKCWDRKQQSATDKKHHAEKQKAAKVIEANPDCVPLDKVPHESYARFDDKPYPDCKACADFKKGVYSYSDRPEPICTNPKCYRAKKSHATMLANRYAAQQWDYRLEHLMAEIDVAGIPAPICRILLDQLGDWRNIKVVAEQLGISGKQGADFEDRVKTAAGQQDLAVQQKLVLRLILEHYHGRDAYSQRGDAVTRAMVMLLGKERAKEIDAGFVPDLKRPASKKAEASR
jgi:hypothetical protein